MWKKIVSILLGSAMLFVMGCSVSIPGEATDQEKTPTQVTEPDKDRKTQPLAKQEETAAKDQVSMEQQNGTELDLGKTGVAATAQPSVEAEQPAATTEQGAEEIPAVSKTHAAENPIAAKVPAVSKTPTATKQRVSASRPVATKAPSGTEKPAATQKLTETRAPAATKKPKATPAPTKRGHYEKVWVVDRQAEIIVEDIYEERAHVICNDCGKDITGNADEHLGKELLNGGRGSFHVEVERIKTGTKTTEVPEKGHWENVWVED